MQTWTNSQPIPRWRLTAPGLSPGDAASQRADPAELLDIEMDELTGMLALIPEPSSFLEEGCGPLQICPSTCTVVLAL